ncbi:MAG TPA: GNAT family N-acetyltransferase [Nocardioides sp.]|nr:GNAT family N-acetyltransferase [Nocardioides sp.]
MQASPDAHRLGPHVVGRRVVVRRLLRGETGPSGGPAMTDILGICTAWGDGRCVVAPETGEPVEIALADIVSGKPVPPRPSVRHRVSAYDAELHVLSLWPDVETRPLGGWLLRAAPPYDGRLRRRANSVLAMGEPGVALPDAVSAIREFYAARDRPALAQVEIGSPEEAGLVDAGWAPVPDKDNHFMIGSVAQVLRQTPPLPEEGVVCLTPTPGSSSGTRPARAEADIEDRARGRAGLDGDWVGLHTVEVHPDHRRRGLATRVIVELLDWAASLGATTAWLHVETHNAAAIGLYEGLGFRTHHTARYLTSPR